MRTIVLIPENDDDARTEYWRNFVWRVRAALERDQVAARVIVGGRDVNDDA